MRFRDMAFALALLALPVQAQASEALWNLLKAGGQVVIMRHAVRLDGRGPRHHAPRGLQYPAQPLSLGAG